MTSSYDASSLKIKKLPKSQCEIVASIAAEIWEKHRSEAVKNVNETVNIDGFRKGMVPENVLVTKVGEMSILEEMAEIAISRAYLDILTDQKIDAISRPAVSVMKLAKGNPLEFKIVTAVVPEVSLPDYNKLAKSEIEKSPKDEDKVSDKDLEDAILRIRKSRVSHEGHDHNKMSAEDHEKEIMAHLPELTDEFVKSIGEFKDVPDFKAKLTTLIVEEKKNEAHEKRRIRIADAIAAASSLEMPDVMIESELNRTEAQFASDIERMGVKLEDYLKHAKKTIDDLRKEWRPHAEKKAKLQLILNAIARQEKLSPTAQEIEEEVKHIIEHYKDADRERAAIYAETVLTNEKVFQFLEKSE